jgi:hypothetical protein
MYTRIRQQQQVASTPFIRCACEKLTQCFVKLRRGVQRNTFLFRPGLEGAQALVSLSDLL